MSHDSITTYPVTDILATLRGDMESATRHFFAEEVVPTVKVHDGDFNVSEIERYRTGAPAVILVLNGGKPHRKGGTLYEQLDCSAFILAKSKVKKERALIALTIYENFLKLLFDTDWGSEVCVGDPTDVDSKNLYSEELDEMGLALWAVRWTLKVEIPYLSDEDRDALPDFKTLFATYTNFRPTELPGDTEASEQQIELETE